MHAPGPAHGRGRPARRARGVPRGGGPAQAALRPACDLPETYVLAVGTVEPRKGLDVLIEAMAKPHAPDLPLVVVGPRGWGGVDLTALAAEHGLPAERLHVLGRSATPTCRPCCAGPRCSPCRAGRRGSGCRCWRRWPSGTPVVHTDVPALVEVAGGAGVAVPRGDAEALAATRCAEVDDGPGDAASGWRRASCGRRRSPGSTRRPSCGGCTCGSSTWRTRGEQHSRRGFSPSRA